MRASELGRLPGQRDPPPVLDGAARRARYVNFVRLSFDAMSIMIVIGIVLSSVLGDTPPLDAVLAVCVILACVQSMDAGLQLLASGRMPSHALLAPGWIAVLVLVQAATLRDGSEDWLQLSAVVLIGCTPAFLTGHHAWILRRSGLEIEGDQGSDASS